ncbi:MAG TPA: hypothetical protein VL966_08610 [Alphaproteobacteria bacterium]|nr:hypothetical protein [Alphaproteobacteria bacterium]
MHIEHRATPAPTRSIAVRGTAAAVAALALLLAAAPGPVLADGLLKDDSAKAMILLMSLSQALAQKGTPAPTKPEAKPVPVAAAERTTGEAVGASHSTPAGAGVSGAATPPAER